jgi:DNA repair protein RecN (Recombination protein N)
MLTDLYIKDLVLIHDLTLNFENGFSVFTGETGAGKSILLDALSLSLGKRGDISLIRKGAVQSVVSSLFKIDAEHDILPFLEEQGLLNPEDKTELHLKRILNEKGSKAFVNDIPVNLQTLKKIGDSLLEIHGQFDTLLDASSHLMYLDDYIKDPHFHETLNTYKEVFGTLKSEQKKLESLLTEEKNQQEFLLIKKNIVDDLTPLEILENEEEALLKERGSIESFGKISSALEKCKVLLNEGSFLKDLGFCINQFDRVEMDFIKPVLEPLKKIESECLEAKDQLENILQYSNDSFMRLNQIDDRLYVLRSKAKKYNVSTEGLLPLLENSKDFLQRDFEILKAELLKKIDETKKIFRKCLSVLSVYRLELSKKLEDDINQELQYLKLPHARFKVSLVEMEEEFAHQKGKDRVEFLISANKNQDFTNLSKSASGGELSRIMLAFKTVLCQKSNLCSIVFDEIETGVSGGIASSIGERMKVLSKKIQVLSITHSPQIAAMSDDHYLVQKKDDELYTKTFVMHLDKNQKVLEVARMLSGESLTEAAIGAAKELINNA